MIIIACKSCGVGIRMTGDTAEFNSLLGEGNPDWYPDKYPCPICKSKAELMEGIEPTASRMLDLRDLTLHEAFAAFNGLGLPEERDCGPTAVVGALLGSRIVRCDTRLIRGSNRSVIYNLTLEDGTVLYLGSSSFGATVYRMSKPQSAVERINEG